MVVAPGFNVDMSGCSGIAIRVAKLDTNLTDALGLMNRFGLQFKDN